MKVNAIKTLNVHVIKVGYHVKCLVYVHIVITQSYVIVKPATILVLVSRLIDYVNVTLYVQIKI